MKKIKYYKQEEVNIGDKIDLNGNKITITEQLINDLPHLFTIIDNDYNDDVDLLEEAKRRYPKGTKFRSLDYDHVIRTVLDDHHIFDISDPTIYCGNTPQNEWKKDDCCSNPEIYKNGKWAEIVKPLFKTEDNVDIYEGDEFYVVHINPLIKIINKRIADKYTLSIMSNEFENKKYFSNFNAAEKYIKKYKKNGYDDLNYIQREYIRRLLIFYTKKIC